jgi:hypothetical protein
MFRRGELLGRDSVSPAAQHFAFGPFLLRSQLDIAELHGFAVSTAASPSLIPVDIILGTVPPNIPGAVAYDSVCQVDPRNYLLHIAGVASFHAAEAIHSGDRVPRRPSRGGR